MFALHLPRPVHHLIYAKGHPLTLFNNTGPSSHSHNQHQSQQQRSISIARSCPSKPETRSRETRAGRFQHTTRTSIGNTQRHFRCKNQHPFLKLNNYTTAARDDIKNQTAKPSGNEPTSHLPFSRPPRPKHHGRPPSHDPQINVRGPQSRPRRPRSNDRATRARNNKTTRIPLLALQTPDPQSPGHYHHDHPIDNFSRPKSLPASSARHAATIQHSGYACPQPPYECFELPAADDPLPPQYHALSYRASEDTPRSNFAQRSPAAYRPQPSHTQPLDQRDWTPQTPNHADQSSRDSMFNVPSGYIFRRRNKSTTAPPAGSNMNAAKTPTAANIPPPPPPPQQEMHLISDAVKLIKAKERQRRRKSVIDFLKKL
jgi:hypothetical protein